MCCGANGFYTFWKSLLKTLTYIFLRKSFLQCSLALKSSLRMITFPTMSCIWGRAYGSSQPQSGFLGKRVKHGKAVACATPTSSHPFSFYRTHTLILGWPRYHLCDDSHLCLVNTDLGPALLAPISSCALDSFSLDIPQYIQN